ncbi:hypothetical protein WJX74_010132 [Apatococcus lobatus]|uniref:F-box domain-containing protein n=1 Tax=Apatococcus lobatus TaxID=904363 RepID=A0AAW1QUI8_9CHLO
MKEALSKGATVRNPGQKCTLPSDLWVLIFTRLPRVEDKLALSAICRVARAAALNDASWSVCDVSLYSSSSKLPAALEAIAQRASAIQHLTGHSISPVNMASWQATWFFMPKMRSIRWSAFTSTFPVHPRHLIRDQGRVPPHIVNIELSLTWYSDPEDSSSEEEDYQKKFSISSLAPSGLAGSLTLLQCNMNRQDLDSHITCDHPLPKCRSIKLEAGHVVVLPICRNIEVIGSSVAFYNRRFWGCAKLPMDVLSLTSLDHLRFCLDQSCDVQPRKIVLIARSLRVPAFQELVSSSLAVLSLSIANPSRSRIDLSSLPQGATSSSCLDGSGYHFDWSRTALA